VIIDVEKFNAIERPLWDELDRLLIRLEEDPGFKLTFDQARRLHYLYERASADLGKLITFSSEPELRRYLESLVSRAYSEIHESRTRKRVRPLEWLLRTLPQTFRRHVNAFWLSLAITIAGCLFGGLAMALDPEAKATILPEMFSSHLGDPTERVRREEAAKHDRLAGKKASFSAFLMQNNITVSIKAMALGMTYGLGTIIVLFYNGVILGLVATDYVMAGQTKFLLGWLLPHGVIEIPAILIGGQAGLILANALIGWGSRVSLTARLRAIVHDLTTLIFGVGVMLVWAGFIEAFLSQYHEPVLPYSVKIIFGCIELVVLVLFLSKAGAKSRTQYAF